MALLSAFVIALVTPSSSDSVDRIVFEREFDDFIKAHDRHYRDADEKADRFEVFRKNFEFTVSENSKGLPYTLGINEFADMTREEFAKTRLGLHSPNSSRWGKLPYLGTQEYSGYKLPRSVDWVEQGAVTNVKNQKACGSCWAFSVTGSLECAWKLKTGNLVPLSEQQLVDCAQDFGEHGCGGGSMENGFKYASSYSMCTEDSYPYEAQDLQCRRSGCTVGIPAAAVIGYKSVKVENPRALMQAVSHQAISVAIEADQQSFQLYQGGVLTADCGSELDHGVLLVGYGNDSGLAYWKVKNSWGSSWGESGYVRLVRSMRRGPGECGIQLDASFPVVKAAPPGPSPVEHPHYGAPPCRDDELDAQVAELGGEVCAPSCDGVSMCPRDVPENTTAAPACVLQDQSTGALYCALVCTADSECPHLGSCAVLQEPMGICLFPTTTLASRDITRLGVDTLETGKLFQAVISV
eukprot:TRINITY_DN12403_c0_g1_i2.p1 TRINITY_DN12403_c0_g1~~TRINITY_DN12403_c0_g1_i2.p1  ORF type:complete len:466 (-),score=47.43 TRINITY_DN12403_c0_g1_i2:319-1716(-)